MSETGRAYFYIYLSVLLWSITGVLGRSIELNEAFLVWYRLIFTLVSMFIYMKFTKVSLCISKKELMNYSILGTILMVHWVCFYGAIKYSNISITLSMLASQALFTAILNPLFGKNRFIPSEILFGTLALAGMWIIFSVEDKYTLGMILAIIASVLSAIFNILNKELVEDANAEVVSFYEILASFVSLTLLLPIHAYFFHPVKVLPNTSDLIQLLILAVFCTHITIVLSLKALQKLSAFTLNLTINLEPVFGILLAFLFFKEYNHLNARFYIGASLILLSVIAHALNKSYVMKQRKTD